MRSAVNLPTVSPKTFCQTLLAVLKADSQQVFTQKTLAEDMGYEW